MKFKIKDAPKGQRYQSLTLKDPSDDLNYIEDFINGGDGKEFKYSPDDGAYICTLEVFKFWKEVIENEQRLILRIWKLKEDHGDNIINEIMQRIPDCDIGNRAEIINYELDLVFKKLELLNEAK